MRNTTEIQTSQMKRFYGQIEIVAKDLGAILIFPHIKVDVVRNKQRSCVLIVGKNLQFEKTYQYMGSWFLSFQGHPLISGATPLESVAGFA